MRVAHHRPPAAPGGAARERGSAGAEVLPFCVLIFVFGTLLLVNAWGVIDAKFAVTSAAREAARTYAESDGGFAGEEAARDAAEDAIASYGRTPSRMELSEPTGAFVRCGTVSYTASYPVPALQIPVIGGFGRAFDVTSSHSTRIDRLRAGLDAASAC
ncbi:hypothetical protein HC251_15520 [Iamia sp. SCSIO 61187]|uniref:hypothetical protein n=1 Tax=Iamia sp. SCSIO 61187 TaxID=2722752 RepID=UPI001C63614F|nr:hypothetical protein [Iamia sp. SCSIO 61187]QYG93693.1 hypothetical protein HC251_15520 [Iamia sp. SCSIO 61187]